jgi:hypothetical protein
MRWPNACPRCQGDLVLDDGDFGPFISCARCGSVLSGPQERVLLGLSRPTSEWRGRARAKAGHEEAVPGARRLTQDDLLHLAIGWVKQVTGGGPDFLWETAAVFEALKREVQSLDSLVRSHERLARVASVIPPVL